MCPTVAAGGSSRASREFSVETMRSCRGLRCSCQRTSRESGRPPAGRRARGSHGCGLRRAAPPGHAVRGTRLRARARKDCCGRRWAALLTVLVIRPGRIVSASSEDLCGPVRCARIRRRPDAFGIEFRRRADERGQISDAQRSIRSRAIDQRLHRPPRPPLHPRAGHRGHRTGHQSAVAGTSGRGRLRCGQAIEVDRAVAPRRAGSDRDAFSSAAVTLRGFGAGRVRTRHRARNEALANMVRCRRPRYRTPPPLRV